MTTMRFAAERWPLAKPFRFAGFVVEALEVVHVTLSQGGVQGQGEGVVPVVFGTTLDEVCGQLATAEARIRDGATIAEVCAVLPPGPARNALDCADWDLRAKRQRTSIWQLAGLPPGPRRLEVDQTIGLDTPEAMSAEARKSPHKVLKIKADASSVLDRLLAIRRARPDAELLVDANQSWTIDDLHRLAPALAALDVAMIEQPLRRGDDERLRGRDFALPLYADESCHTRDDLPGLIGLYQGINIKLDKTGGLTEALALAQDARTAGMGIMVGCMAGTSLSMAPAFVVGTLARWADLDGPLLLTSDRAAPMAYADGHLAAFSPSLWG